MQISTRLQDAIEVKVLTQEDKLLLQVSFENSSDFCQKGATNC